MVLQSSYSLVSSKLEVSLFGLVVKVLVELGCNNMFVTSLLCFTCTDKKIGECFNKFGISSWQLVA